MVHLYNHNLSKGDNLAQHSIQSHFKRSCHAISSNPADEQPLVHQHSNKETKTSIPSKLFKHILAGQPQPTTIKVYSKPKARKQKNAEITEQFINDYNSGIGSEKRHKEALLLLNKMKQLGGIIPHAQTSPYINIPKARIGLAMLAGINDPDIKMSALNALHDLLIQDDLSKDSATQIVTLAITFAKIMNRERLQTEIVDVQLKIAEVYGEIAEQIQRHHHKKHINAITDKLRTQLIKAARDLRRLNRLDDIALNYAVENSLEGIKRIVDDRQEVYELISSIYNTAIAATMLYHGDMQSFHETMQRAFGGIDPRFKNAWYSASLLLRDIAKKGVENSAELLHMQALIGLKGKRLNWRFLYNAADILAEIVINGKTPEIRKNALLGTDLFGENFPGLLNLMGYNQLKTTPNLWSVMHFQLPKFTNQNLLVKKRAFEQMFRIANESPDSEIRFQAKQGIINAIREAEESNLVSQKKKNDLLIYLKKAFEPYEGKQQNWLEENGEFACKMKTNPQESPELELSDEPVHQHCKKRPSEHITEIFHQHKRHNPLTHSVSKLIHLASESSSQLIASAPSYFSLNSKASKLAILLGEALEIEPEEVTRKLRHRPGIQLNGDEHLTISLRGMQNIIELLKATPCIQTLDLNIFKGNLEGLYILFDALPDTHIETLRLPSPITDDEAVAIAELLQKMPELDIDLSDYKEIVLIADKAAELNLLERSDDLLTQAIRLAKQQNLPGKITSQLYWKRASLAVQMKNSNLAAQDFKTAKTLEKENHMTM